jgi:hypothetical protein
MRPCGKDSRCSQQQVNRTSGKAAKTQLGHAWYCSKLVSTRWLARQRFLVVIHRLPPLSADLSPSYTEGDQFLERSDRHVKRMLIAR